METKLRNVWLRLIKLRRPLHHFRNQLRHKHAADYMYRLVFSALGLVVVDDTLEQRHVEQAVLLVFKHNSANECIHCKHTYMWFAHRQSHTRRTKLMRQIKTLEIWTTVSIKSLSWNSHRNQCIFHAALLTLTQYIQVLLSKSNVWYTENDELKLHVLWRLGHNHVRQLLVFIQPVAVVGSKLQTQSNMNKNAKCTGRSNLYIEHWCDSRKTSCCLITADTYNNRLTAFWRHNRQDQTLHLVQIWYTKKTLSRWWVKFEVSGLLWYDNKQSY